MGTFTQLLLPRAEQAHCSKRAMMSVLKRGDAPSEEYINFSCEVFGIVYVKIKEYDFLEVCLFKDRIQEL